MSHPAVFFPASFPPDYITLNPANKRTDQSLSDFQSDTGTAAHATLDTEQLISHTRFVFVFTIVSVQGSGSGVIAALEVHELLTKIHDILDSAGLIIPLIFWHLFNSASREHCEVWTSQFPFFTILRILFLLVRFVFMAFINWSLTQAFLQSLLGAKSWVQVLCTEMACARDWWCILGKEDPP